MTYKEKLQTLEWKNKKQALINARGYKCQQCGVKRDLTIHHGYYTFKTEPWEYPDSSLWILCWNCHEKVQLQLAAIHSVIGHTSPDYLEKLLVPIEDAAHELAYGVTKSEIVEILEEERKAQQSVYEGYSVNLVANNDLGESKTSDTEEQAIEMFPGIEIYISFEENSPDGVSVVDGPNADTVNYIQGWFDERI